MSSTTQERMFSLIRQWQDCGMSQTDFCRRKELAYSSFHYWYKKYRVAGQSETEPSFVPLSLPEQVTDVFCSVHLPQGVTIDFHQPVPVGYLNQIGR
jgi:hypothetical protein